MKNEKSSAGAGREDPKNETSEGITLYYYHYESFTFDELDRTLFANANMQGEEEV